MDNCNLWWDRQFLFFSAGDPVAIRAVGSLNNRSLNRFQLRHVAFEFGGVWWCYHWVISTELKNKNIKNWAIFKKEALEYHLCKTRCGITSVLLGIKFMISILIHFKALYGAMISDNLVTAWWQNTNHLMIKMIFRLLVIVLSENLWSLVRISFGIYTLAYRRRRSFLL